MKKISGLLVILVAIVLGGYYGMGIMTERAVKKNIDVINASNNGVIVDLDAYQRGWFSSTATLNWRLHLPERLTTNAAGEHQALAAQDYSVQMPLKVAHGPIIFANKSVYFGLGFAYTDVNIPPQYMAQFDKVFTAESVKPKLAIKLYVSYFNRSTLNIDVPNFKLIAKENGGELKWLGMSTGVQISSNLNHYDGSMEIEGFEFSLDKNTVTMGKLVSDYDFERSPQGLYLGEASMTLPSFVINQSKQKLLELEKWRFDTFSKVHDGLFDTELSTSLGKFYANGKSFGPVEIKVTLRNLDADVLGKINQQANQLQQANDEDRQRALIGLLPELPKLFTKGAEFAIDKFTVLVPDGTVEGKLLITMPAENIDNPFQIMHKVKGNGRLAIPATLLQELLTQSAKQRVQNQAQAVPTPVVVDANSTAAVTVDGTAAPTAAAPESLDVTVKKTADQMLSAMLNSGLIVKDGADYVVEATLAEGQMQLNNKPFSSVMLNF